MPYKPTGNPPGRPRKLPIEQPARKPKSGKRRFLSSSSPEPFKAPVDTSAPAMGQRKRKRVRHARLFPTPLQAD